MSSTPQSNVKTLIDISVPQVSLLTLLVSLLSRRFPDHSDPLRTAAVNQVHDWLILLDREVEHIWRGSWSLGKVLFFITRYGPFLDMPLTTTSELDPSIVGIGETLTRIVLFAAHNAPYGAISGEVGIGGGPGYHRLANRDISDMRYPPQGLHL